jgi:phage gp36-like protein
MGIYATIANFNLRDKTLTYLTRDEDSAETTPDDAVSNAAIDDAETEVNSYIAKRYDLPLKINIPPYLRLVTIRIAVYYLWLNKKNAVTEDVLDNYDRSIKKLEKISNGTITLGADANDENSAVGPNTVEIERC